MKTSDCDTLKQIRFYYYYYSSSIKLKLKILSLFTTGRESPNYKVSRSQRPKVIWRKIIFLISLAAIKMNKS